METSRQSVKGNIICKATLEWRGTFVMTLINHEIINKDDIPVLLFYILRRPDFTIHN